MKHSKTIQKAIHNLLKFKNDFDTMLNNQITELFEIGKLENMTQIVNFKLNNMSGDESKEFLTFQSHMLSKFQMLINIYMDEIKLNDITIFTKKLQKDTT